jgi:DeoR/GlpR family transcriptional regulator of sugar metabolism
VDVSYTKEDRRRHIMATLYKSDSRGEAMVEIANLARLLEADLETMRCDLKYLEGIGYVRLTASKVALTEVGYLAMDNREFSFCPHL